MRRPQVGQTHSSAPDSPLPLRIISCLDGTVLTFLLSGALPGRRHLGFTSRLLSVLVTRVYWIHSRYLPVCIHFRWPASLLPRPTGGRPTRRAALPRLNSLSVTVKRSHRAR